MTRYHGWWFPLWRACNHRQGTSLFGGTIKMSGNMDHKDDVHDEELYLKAVKVFKAKGLNILTLLLYA